MGDTLRRLPRSALEEGTPRNLEYRVRPSSFASSHHPEGAVAASARRAYLNAPAQRALIHFYGSGLLVQQWPALVA